GLARNRWWIGGSPGVGGTVHRDVRQSRLRRNHLAAGVPCGLIRAGRVVEPGPLAGEPDRRPVAAVPRVGEGLFDGGLVAPVVVDGGAVATGVQDRVTDQGGAVAGPGVQVEEAGLLL